VTEEPTARELIEALRGKPPTKCDYCHKETLPEHLEPEEGGEWACHECLRRWGEW
jgi:hypothetical protein